MSTEVDPAQVRFLFQGASDSEYRGNGCGAIPWRLGILERQQACGDPAQRSLGIGEGTRNVEA